MLVFISRFSSVIYDFLAPPAVTHERLIENGEKWGERFDMHLFDGSTMQSQLFAWDESMPR